MVDIETKLSAYKAESTVQLDNDGYIGIPVEMTMFHDEAKTIKPGYGGTPVILYVVNTQVERIGTDSDVTIIQSMLNRGYVVLVVDYLNHAKAVSPALDYSIQEIRASVQSRAYFTSTLPSGTYYDNHVVPAGYNVRLGDVFWEIDKHASDGTLEKIVENWNNDLRGTQANDLVKWVHADGTRKKTQTASDGTTPVWYNASGTVDTNGQYTKVKYTVAETVTDCVNPDGSPIDLDLTMDIIYPTNPKNSVPVMALASSSAYFGSATQTADRPHMNGFLFNGYAGMVYDHLFVPMQKQTSFGYYDGKSAGAVSGDTMTYSLQIYNDKKINTAAMRYVRYLSLSNGSTFNFDQNAIGVYGNSKGGWFIFLGSEDVQTATVENPGNYATTEALEKAIDANITSFTEKRQYPDHHGETRYANGLTDSYTVDGLTVDGGELQPWLTYNGEEILSGAQFIYASNGMQDEDITDNQAATVVTAHFKDDYNSHIYFANREINLCREHDVATLFFELPTGHTFMYGEDLNYDVDTYLALFDFAGYYLKNDAVKVIYSDPLKGHAGVAVDSPITVKFTGPVSATEIEKVTVADSQGNTLDGVWTAQFGRTEWTFTPEIMSGSTTYTLNVPSDLKGENGKTIGEQYESTFITEYDSATTATVATGEGMYYYFTVPALTENANSYTLRFRVTNDAANTAGLYSVTDFDPTNLATAMVGEKLDEINLRGLGYYEIDVTPYVAEKTGQQVAFFIKTEKQAEATTVFNATFEDGLHGAVKVDYSVLSQDTINGNGVMKVVLKNNDGQYKNNTYYGNLTNAFKISNILGETITEADYGRKFTISMRVYDTISRVMEMRLNSCSSETYDSLDYDWHIYNYQTKAGEWTTFEFEYVVYDTDYGKVGLHAKDLFVLASPDGNLETPIYIDDIVVKETVTNVTLDTVELALKDNGGVAYKAPTSEKAFALYSQGTKLDEYATWAETFAAYQDGQSVQLQNNYVFTDDDLWNGYAAYNTITIDLNGYTLTSLNSKNSIFWVKNTVATGASLIPQTCIIVKNGGILLKDTPLISYEDSAASGAGKTFDFAFENVNFGVVKNAMLTNVISGNTIDSSSKTTANITFTDCVFNIADDNLSTAQATLLPAGNGALSLQYKMYGGSIRLDSQRWVTIQEQAKSSIFLKNDSGEYTTLVLPASITPSSASYMRDDGYATYDELTSVDANGYATYNLYKGELSTAYGIIPSEYSDKTLYPFVIFDPNGNCVSATSNFTSVLAYTATQVQGEWIVLLRKDYTYTGSQYNNLAFIYGTLTIDLGGYTFTEELSSGRLFDAYAKRVNATNIIVKNGTMVVGDKELVYFNSGSTAVYDGSVPKNFNFTFEEVKFSYVSGYSTVNTLFGSSSSTSIRVNGNITLIDCVLDLMGVESSFTVFNIGSSNQAVQGSVVVEGGEIYTSSFENITLYNVNNSNSSISFEKNEEGNYLKAIVSAGGSAPTGIIPTSSGEMAFIKSDETSTYVVYVLSDTSIATKYGSIPIAYESTTTYPFAVFKNGEFIGAYGTWKETQAAAVGQCFGSTATNTEVQILLRDNYTNTANDAYDNLSQIGGTLVVDLNGYSLTRDGANLFNLFAKQTDGVVHDTTVKVLHGSLLAKTQAVLTLNHINSDAYTTKKTFELYFDDVTFGFASGATTTNLVAVSWGDGGLGCDVDMAFTDCTFDVKTNVPSQNVCIFNLSEDKNLVNGTLKLNGGEILAETLDTITLYTYNGDAATSNDQMYFGKGNNGYTKLMLLATATVPTEKYIGVSGEELIFVQIDSDGSNITYQLATLITDYGTIPDEYSSIEDYPFAVFKDGVFQGAYSNWKGALTKAKGQSFGKYSTSTVEILLRRDYTTDSTDSGFSGDFGQIGGTVILDLNGYTMIRGSAYIFDALARHTIEQNAHSGEITVHNTTILVKNGKLLAKGGAIGNFNQTTNASYTSVKTFNFTFNNVTFGLAEGATTDKVIFVNWCDGSVACTANVVFNDCIFDFRTVEPTKNVTVFPLQDTKDLTNTNIIINGGQIVANTFEKIKWYTANNGDALVFNKKAGVYTTLTLSASGVGLADIFSTDEGDKSFAKVSASGSDYLYELRSNIETKYGMIPGAYESTAEYPFAVFKNGELLGAYSTWFEALNKAKAQAYGKYSTDTVQILLRRNYTTDDETQVFDNLSQIGGVLILDLNGFTFTRGSMHIFNAAAKHTPEQNSRLGEMTIHDTKIEVINGTMLVKTNAIIALNHWNMESYTSRKTFYFTFTDVTFGFAQGATSNALVCVSYWTGSNGIGANGELTFNNCVFDCKTNAPTKPITIFNFNDNENNWITGKANINGGEIVVNSLENVTLYTACGDDDGVVFGKYKDESTMLDYNSDELIPWGALTTTEGDMYFQKDETSGKYQLNPCGHLWDNACDSICNICDEERTVSPHTGGNATCQELAICQECGVSYGELGEHQYSESLSYNDNEHWSECHCGEKRDVASHTYGDWIVTKEATEDEPGLREKTCQCGHKLTEPIEQLPDSGGCGGCDSCNSRINTLGAIGFLGVLSTAVTLYRKKKAAREE